MVQEPITPILPIKPGYKTTEFWTTLIFQGLSLAVIFGVITSTDSVGLGSTLVKMVENVVALIVAGAAVVHYISSRTSIKGG